MVLQHFQRLNSFVSICFLPNDTLYWMSFVALNSTNILLFVSHRHQLELMQSAVGFHYNQCYCVYLHIACFNSKINVFYRVIIILVRISFLMYLMNILSMRSDICLFWLIISNTFSSLNLETQLLFITSCFSSVKE